MTNGYDRAGNKLRSPEKEASLVRRLGLETGDISHGYRYEDGCHPASALRQMDVLAALVSTNQGEKGLMLFYPLRDEVAMYGVEMYEFMPDGTAKRVNQAEIDIGALPANLAPNQAVVDTLSVTVEAVAGFVDAPISVDVEA